MLKCAKDNGGQLWGLLHKSAQIWVKLVLPFHICTLWVFNSSSGFGGCSASHVALPSWIPAKYFMETIFTYLIDFVMSSMTQMVFLDELLYKMTPIWLF